MGAIDKVSEVLNITTAATAEEATQLARDTIEQLDRVGTWRLRITDEAQGWFRVTIKPTATGLLSQRTTFTVRASSDQHVTRVVAEIENAAVYQQKLWRLIPIGPKTVPGATAYQRSLAALRAAFDAGTDHRT